MPSFQGQTRDRLVDRIQFSRARCKWDYVKYMYNGAEVQISGSRTSLMVRVAFIGLIYSSMDQGNNLIQHYSGGDDYISTVTSDCYVII